MVTLTGGATYTCFTCTAAGCVKPESPGRVSLSVCGYVYNGDGVR